MNEMRKLMETIERINEDDRCEWCSGRGTDPMTPWQDCRACDGAGTSGEDEPVEEDIEDEPCSICKGQGSEWDPYATYEGGAYRDCEACRGTGDESVRLGELEDDLDEATE